MIVMDMHSASIVNDKGFCSLVSVLDPRYVLPIQRTIMLSLLPKQEEKMKIKVLQKLEIVQACSITTDFWSSRTSTSYIKITRHFIDDTWNLKSYVLKTWNVSVSHTADNAAIAKEWHISNKIVAVVSDNATNMKAEIH